MVFLKITAIVILGYYGIQLFLYWLALLAAGERRLLRSLPQDVHFSVEKPFLYVVAPCRDAAGAIRGLVQCLKAQDYPKDRYRILLLIDSEDPDDPAVGLARSLGAEVYHRLNGKIRTKGDALNELLDRHLRHVTFDAVTILDADSRVSSDFLSRVAACLNNGASIIQSQSVSKNPNDNALTRIAAAAFSLTWLHQRGRKVLGFSGQLLGTGMTLSRTSLVRLEWRIGEGRHLSEDLELMLRCLLAGLPVHYAEDQEVFVDLPENDRLILRQRRRWNAGGLELIGCYTWPMLRKVFYGEWRMLFEIFGSLLAPPFSILFLAAGLFTFILHSLRIFIPHLSPWANMAAVLWLVHGLFYVTGLRIQGFALAFGDLKALFVFMRARIRGLREGIPLAFSTGNRWEPMPHETEKEVHHVRN